MEINFSIEVNEEISKESSEAVTRYIEENIGGADYYDVHNEESRESATEGLIKESLWAFNANFILMHTSTEIHPNQLQQMQETMCESANGIIAGIITNMDIFINDAINEDGYGHFLSTFDGKEHELELGGETYFLYAN